MYRGVYAAFTGVPSREAALHAALLRVGAENAVLSHYTAAELWGLNRDPSQSIHVTVPRLSNPARYGKIPGVVVHKSDAILLGKHPARSLSCTRVEDTVLDIIRITQGFDEAYNWICRGVGSGRTTADRIREALDARPRFPRRRELKLALGDASEGVLSWLERQYVYGVERPHGLPEARRQHKIRLETGNRYLDNYYDEYRVCAEMDGTAAHPAAEQWRDKRRDRQVLVADKTLTVRFGYLDVRTQSSKCETAADMARILRDRGPAVGYPCGVAGCPVAAPG